MPEKPLKIQLIVQLKENCGNCQESARFIFKVLKVARKCGHPRCGGHRLVQKPQIRLERNSVGRKLQIKKRKKSYS